MQGRIVWASLVARRARVALAMAAVTLGVGVAVALGTLALRVGDDLARDLRRAGPNFVLLPEGASWPLDLGGATYQPARAGAELDPGVVAAMKTTFWKNNILDAAPELLAVAEGPAGRFVLTGTWFEHDVPAGDETWRTGLVPLRPGWRVDGRWPDGAAAEIVLGRNRARQLTADLGDALVLSAGSAPDTFTVTGIVSAGGLDDDGAWAPLARVQRISGRTSVDRVWFSALVRAQPPGESPDPVKDPEAFEAFMCTAYPANVARELTEHLGGTEALPLTEVVAGEAQVVSRLNMLMLLLALAGLTVSILGLLSTTTASVLERSIEIGLLRSIGAGPFHIGWLILAETGLVSLAGGLAGWTLGSVAALLIRGDVYGAGATFQPVLLPLALGVAVVVALLGTLAPLRLALRMDPAEVLRG